MIPFVVDNKSNKYMCEQKGRNYKKKDKLNLYK